MRTLKNKVFLNIGLPIMAVATVFVVWWAAAEKTGSQLLLPSPSETLKEVWELVRAGWFWRAFGHTLGRSVLSFVVAFVLAIGLAALAATVRGANKFMRPIISVLRAVPTMSVILLMMVWVGSRVTPLLVALLVIFPTMFTGFYAGFTSIDKELLEMEKVFRVSLGRRIGTVYLPLASPTILETAAGGISLNLKLIVAAEVLAQTRQSLGLIMQQSQVYFETGRLLAVTLVVIVASSLMEGAILLVKKAVERKLYN